MLDERCKWLLLAFIASNEVRGLFAAYEGAQWMGWILWPVMAAPVTGLFTTLDTRS
jgi:hypothetical protein